MKKAAGILAVALFTLGMFATAINTVDQDFSDESTAVASDRECHQKDTRDA